MSAKGDTVASLVNEVKDLHLTNAGRTFLFGYLAEHNPEEFRKALDTLIMEDERGRHGRLTGDRETIHVAVVSATRLATIEDEIAERARAYGKP